MKGELPESLLQLSRRYQLDFTDEVLVHIYVAHGHERALTNLPNVLRGHLFHLEKYRADLRAHPKTLRSRYLEIAWLYHRLRDRNGVKRHTLLAVLAYPYNLGTYAWLVGALFGPSTFRLAVKLHSWLGSLRDNIKAYLPKGSS